MASNEWDERAGSPSPLGATWDAGGRSCNFALYSKHATSVRLLLFAEGSPSSPLATHELAPPVHKSSRVWHTRLSAQELLAVRYYAYSVSGPHPAGRFEDHAFDSEKVLLDPYAPEIYFPPAFSRDAASRPGSNMGRAPLGVVPHPTDA